MTKIILNIPHSQTVFPGNSMDQWDNIDTLKNDMSIWTDHYAHELFVWGAETLDVIPVVYQYSRYYCDVERLIDDPLDAVGRGIIYTKLASDDGERKVSAEERAGIMSEYRAYHEHITELLEDGAMLIDCHSFSQFLAEDVDICIGFNEDRTKPADQLLGLIENHFREWGYRVAFNKPYSNSLAPGSQHSYTSFMIEANKHLYLEDDLSKGPFFYKVNGSIIDLYKKLGDHQQSSHS